MNTKTLRSTKPRVLHRQAVGEMVRLHPLRSAVFVGITVVACYGASILLGRYPRHMIAGLGVLASAIVTSAVAVKVLFDSPE